MIAKMITIDPADRRDTPEWAPKIDRWYQLDEVSYSFCEAIYQWKYFAEAPKPTRIFLAVDGASNISDFEFAHAAAASPAKFVYTLPNICASVVFQLIGHHGQIFCVHQGASTFDFAKSEAATFAHQGEVIWVLHTCTSTADSKKRDVHFAVYR